MRSAHPECQRSNSATLTQFVPAQTWIRIATKAVSMEHRNISFKIDILGVDTWRWTILPRTLCDLTLVGQVRATQEQAIAHCKAEIDAMLARESEKSSG